MRGMRDLAFKCWAWVRAATLCLAAAFCGPASAQAQASNLPSAGAAGFTWQRVAGGVAFQAGDWARTVTFYGPAIVRVTALTGPSHARQPSLVVVAAPETAAPAVDEDADSLRIAAPKLRVRIDKRSGALAFQRADGSALLREAAGGTVVEPTAHDGDPSWRVAQTFTLADDESLYGLGQYNQPYWDYRGRDVLMVQTNIGIVVPFMLSTRRWGMLWDATSKMRFTDTPQGATFRAENAPGGADYYLVAGNTMDEVVAGYRHLTGAAPMFPKSAFGFFMSKERYQTQQELIDVVRRFRAERFPLDWIVQDWQYWGRADDGSWSGMTWDATRYPDPAALTRTLHDELHTRLMVSIWPAVGNDSALAHELDAKGLRFAPPHWISRQARIYDAFSDEGRAIYYRHVKRGLLDAGVDALWMDGTEVEVGGAAHDPAEVEADILRLGRNAMGDAARYLNVYSLLTTRGVYEGQRNSPDLGGRRVLTLTRSAWAGQQRYAALPWSGDTTASWDTLRAQIAGGLNVAMAGLPYWTQDTGGFFVNVKGGVKDAAYRELYARWHQFAVFNPIYRVHGTNIEREPWVFKTLDPAVYRSLRRAAELRYRLLPYVYSLAGATTQQGYTMMRGLPMDFPDQPALRGVADTFMFGPALLVQPITRGILHAELPPAATVPATQLRTGDGRAGLAVTYYDGMAFERAAGSTLDAVVEHDWPGPPLAGPPPGLDRLENFSARWQGELVAREGGEHEIGLEGDDGFRLWLDDKLVVDDWAEAAARWGSTRITLRAGQVLRVRIDYYQKGGGRVLRLGWREPSALRDQADRQRRADPRQATLLPAGSVWHDFWNERRLAGGSTVRRRYAIDEFPLFVRAGSIVPLGPVVQHTGEQPGAPWEIRVYPGADGRFTLYEDDGIGYGYERGEFSTVALRWDERTRTLHVGAREGAYPGMVARRTLQVRVVGTPGRRSVVYDGRPQVLRFPPARCATLPECRNIP